MKLHSGENNFYIEIPEVSQAQEDVLTVKQGREILYTEPIKINPVRHWQMNLVQHTHTDIGYTRSQMEILAEHLRYIDYALDFVTLPIIIRSRQSFVGLVKFHGLSANI